MMFKWFILFSIIIIVLADNKISEDKMKLSQDYKEILEGIEALGPNIISQLCGAGAEVVNKLFADSGVDSPCLKRKKSKEEL